MRTVFTDPVGWTASAVGTKARYLFMLVALPVLVWVVVALVHFAGWRSAIGLAVLLTVLQVAIVFSLRQLHLRLSNTLPGAGGSLRPNQSLEPTAVGKPPSAAQLQR